jgi:hypothetical protein
MIKRTKKSTETVRQKFNKGLCTYKNFFNLEEGQSPACINVQFNNDASFGKRLGSSTMNTIALESTAGYGMFEFGVINVIGGLDSNTKLLLHCNGVDTSNTFIDSSSDPKTVTVQGSTQVDTDQYKFGGGSAYFSSSLSAYGANILTGGTASADSDSGGSYPASNALDGNTSTYWFTSNTAFPHYWKYDLGVGVTKIAAKLRMFGNNYRSKDFVLAGSNNDSTWTDIYTGQMPEFSGSWYEFTFANATAYRYYKITFSTEWLGENYCVITEIEMMEFNTSAGYLTVSTNNNFPKGLKDFTIDEQVMFKFTTASQTLIGQGISANDNWVLRWNTAAVNTSNCLTFQAYSGGVLVVNLSGPYVPSTSTWYHLEVARSATSNWYVFVNGSNIASTGTTDGVITGSGSLVKIGVNVVTTADTYFEGWMDEIRISNIARHTSDFTSPTEEYSYVNLQQRRLICASGTGIYNSENLGKTWAIIQTNRTATINYFSLVKDYIINTNESYDIPQYWAGSSDVYFANISTATPACKHSLSHQGFAIFLNESSKKTSMYYVDQNDLFTEPFSNFALPTDRNDELTGGFSLGRNLYVSSKYKIFRLNYIGGSPDWEYIEVRGFGFVPKTMKKISLPNAGEAVIGLDWTKKLRVFLGSEDEIISDSIQTDNGMTSFYLNNINSIDMNKCWAENDRANGVYKLFLVYGDSSIVSHCINFNYRTGTLYPDDGQTFNSGVLAADTADNLFMLGCNYNGRIHVMNSGNTDAGVPINDYYISPYYYNQSPSRVHKGQQIDLFFSESSSGTLCYQERSDFKNDFGECHDISLDKSGSSQIIRHTIDIPETQNVYQFKLGSSANTAESWQLNLIDLSNSDIGIGEG